MHAIKSQARRHHWRGTEHNGLARFIPYADRIAHRRMPSSSMLTDVEKSTTKQTQTQTQTQTEDGYEASRIHSESCLRTFGEIERDQDNNTHAPPRSSTEPSNPSPTTNKKGKQYTGTSGETLVGSSSSSEDSGPKFRIPFARRSTANDDLEKSESRMSRTSTRKSRKEQPLPAIQQFKAVFWSWPNILLVCVPIGIAINYAGNVSPLAIFLVNFLAIIPLAGTLSYATEELAMRVGETLGGLLNASFGNATELITAIIALAQGQITIVQTSLVGSMLSNLLLVLGMCFAFGGYNRPEQHFNMTVAQTACSLLILAGASLIIPTAFQQMSSAPDNQTQPNIPRLSRGTAIILLFVYACYLFFQLRTHVTMYNEPSEKVQTQNLVRRNTSVGNVSKATAVTGTNASAVAGEQANAENIVNDGPSSAKAAEDEEGEEGGEKEIPNLSLTGGLVTLCGATALIGLCSEFVVENINAVAVQNHVPLEFIGLILLPIVGNAAEHATAVTVAIKDKMDLSIGVAVGSSLQIALLVLPISVVIGWIIGPVTPSGGLEPEGPMTLNFDGFIIAILFVTILLVNFLIGDGKSHWLEGVMLIMTYIIIAVAAWFYPDPAGLGAE